MSVDVSERLTMNVRIDGRGGMTVVANGVRANRTVTNKRQVGCLHVHVGVCAGVRVGC